MKRFFHFMLDKIIFVVSHKKKKRKEKLQFFLYSKLSFKKKILVSKIKIH